MNTGHDTNHDSDISVIRKSHWFIEVKDTLMGAAGPQALSNTPTEEGETEIVLKANEELKPTKRNSIKQNKRMN